MSRKNWIQISITLVMVFALVSQAVCKQEKLPEKSLRKVTPDKPLIFAQLAEASSIVNTDSIFYKQVVQAPFWELVLAKLETSSGVKDIQMAIEPGISLLAYILGEDIVFVLPQFQQLPEVSPLLMLRLRKGDDTLRDTIAGGVKIALANVAGSTSQYGGYTIAAIPLGEDVPFAVYFAMMDDILAVGLGDASLRKVIDLLNDSQGAKSIVEDNDFSSAIQRLPLPNDSKTDQHLSVFYLDFAKILALGKSFYPLAQGNIPQEIRPLADKMLEWLDLVPSISAVGSITDEGIISQTYMALNSDATAQNFLRMLQAEPENLDSMKFAPEDAINYAATNLIDLKFLWNMLYGVLSDFPQFGEEAIGQLGQMQQQIGFNFGEDLFSWMGNEIAYISNDYTDFSEEDIPTDLCLVIEVTDNEKALQGLKKIGETIAGLSSGEMTINEQEYSGGRIYKIANTPPPFSPGYALVDNYLLISPSTEYIQELIDCAAGKKKGLEANPRFQAVKGKLPRKVNGIQFTDNRRQIEDILNSINERVEEDMPSWEDGNLEVGEAMALQVFELLELLSQALGASVVYTINDGAGLKTASFMSIEDLKKVTPITDPDTAKIARNLEIASTYEEAGMLDKALARYRQVLKLDPDNSQANAGVTRIRGE